jgi:transcriptional regulator with XRE-family HTH domain
MKWDELRRMKFSDEEIREIDRESVDELIEMDLRVLRESAGKTQIELAQLSKLAQSELSKIERRDDHMVSTLRRYIEGLGGRLEVSAVFGDTRITLRDV